MLNYYIRSMLDMILYCCKIQIIKFQLCVCKQNFAIPVFTFTTAFSFSYIKLTPTALYSYCNALAAAPAMVV